MFRVLWKWLREVCVRQFSRRQVVSKAKNLGLRRSESYLPCQRPFKTKLNGRIVGSRSHWRRQLEPTFGANKFNFGHRGKRVRPQSNWNCKQKGIAYETIACAPKHWYLRGAIVHFDSPNNNAGIIVKQTRGACCHGQSWKISWLGDK